MSRCFELLCIFQFSRGLVFWPSSFKIDCDAGEVAQNYARTSLYGMMSPFFRSEAFQNGIREEEEQEFIAINNRMDMDSSAVPTPQVQISI